MTRRMRSSGSSGHQVRGLVFHIERGDLLDILQHPNRPLCRPAHLRRPTRRLRVPCAVRRGRAHGLTEGDHHVSSRRTEMLLQAHDRSRPLSSGHPCSARRRLRASEIQSNSGRPSTWIIPSGAGCFQIGGWSAEGRRADRPLASGAAWSVRRRVARGRRAPDRADRGRCGRTWR
jgi:hypothetical protein